MQPVTEFLYLLCWLSIVYFNKYLNILFYLISSKVLSAKLLTTAAATCPALGIDAIKFYIKQREGGERVLAKETRLVDFILLVFRKVTKYPKNIRLL